MRSAVITGAHSVEVRNVDDAVLPGDPLELRAWEPLDDGAIPFSVATPEAVALAGGLIRFG